MGRRVDGLCSFDRWDIPAGWYLPRRDHIFNLPHIVRRSELARRFEDAQLEQLDDQLSSSALICTVVSVDLEHRREVTGNLLS